MDRFIANQEYRDVPPIVDLKSNMDRFIVTLIKPENNTEPNLKSNMDRFIARHIYGYAR